jgi:hypothetical protein
MDANQRESGASQETDPIRAYALQNAALAEFKPRRGGSPWVLPFLASLFVIGLILATVYYFWGR